MSQPPDAQATYLVGDVGAGARVIVGSNITYVENRKPPPEIRFGPPGDLPDFVDRDEPLAMLRDRASAALKGASPTSVLLNVVGFPGVGKSALVIHLIHTLMDEVVHDRLYVDLHGYQPERLDASVIIRGFLAALGIPDDEIPARPEAQLGLYWDITLHRRLLVVLDNAYTGTQIESLRPSGRSCAVVVTSRRPLGLAGATVINIDVLSPKHAAELVQAVAGARRDLDDASRQELTRLCGYLPLALRIAAGKLASRPSWHVRHLINRLRDERRRLGVLQDGTVNARATFYTSYADLTQKQRCMFRRLGLLSGRWTNSLVAAALFDMSDLTDTEDILLSLVDNRLIEHPADGKYSMHDLMRDFARERAAAEDGDNVSHAALARALNVYIALAAHARSQLDLGMHRVACSHELIGDLAVPASPSLLAAEVGPDAALWFAAERGNLLAAVERAANTQLSAETCHLVEELAPFLEQRGFWAEWKHILYLALTAARQATDTRTEAVILRDLGRVTWVQGDWTAAAQLFDTALGAFRQVGDQLWAAYVEVSVGVMKWHLGHAREARANLESALSTFRQLDQHWVATTLAHLAEVDIGLGNPDLAERELIEALQLFERTGKRFSAGTMLVYLGDVARARQHWQSAISYYIDGLSRIRESGDPHWEAAAMRGLGVAHVQAGDLSTAEALFTTALKTFQRLADERGTATVRVELASLRLHEGMYADVLDCLAPALEVFDRLGARRWLARVLQLSGMAYRESGQIELARANWHKSLQLYRALDAPEAAEVVDNLAALPSSI